MALVLQPGEAAAKRRDSVFVWMKPQDILSDLDIFQLILWQPHEVFSAQTP